MKKNVNPYQARLIWRKSLLTMKLTLIGLLCSIYMAVANDGFSQNSKLSVEMKDVSIETILKNIEKQSDYRFFYNALVDVDRKTSISVDQESVNKILDEIFTNTDIDYKILGTQIALQKREQENGEAVKALLERRVIKGRVVSAEGETLPSVSIVIKGTTVGTVTDLDGNFSLEADDNAILIFSFIGYASQEVAVAGKETLEIVLREDVERLDEVVVVGYGTQSRSKMTTSVSKLDTKVLESAPLSNPASALQGTVAGLRVQTTTGQPGSTPSIVLRGGTDWNGSGSPLVLVDGVVSSFYALNTEDIESMEVLKDAAATAIYGARAANGVVLISTKKGKVGKSEINYKYKFGTNKKRDIYDYLSAADYVRYNRQAVKNYTMVTGRTNFDAGFLNGRSGGFGTGNNTTDSPFTTMILSDENRYLLNQPGWQKIVDPINPDQELIFMENKMSELFFQSSHVHDHYLSFDGGNQKGTYSLGLGYLDNTGIVFGSGFERYSGKLNASYKVAKNVEVNSSLLYSSSSINGTYLGSDRNVFERAAGQPPTSRIYNNNPDGTLSTTLQPGTNWGFGNPLYYQDKFMKDNLEQRLTAAVALDWKILPELKLTLKGSYFNVNNTNESFNKAYLNAGSLISSRNASVSHKRTTTNQYTALLNYKKTFFKDHSFDVLLGTEYYNNDVFSFSAGTKNSPTDLIPTLNAGSEANGVPSSSKAENRIMSVFGRLAYDYKAKYLVNVNFRRDGSSKLGNDKFGIFPGVSLGWNMHNEGFFSNSEASKVISKIKPRVSYGVNGNIDVLSNYGVFGEYGDLGVYDGQTGYGNTSLPTLDLKWERSTTFDVGIDLGLFDNKVSILADYFVRDVEDKIAGLTLPYWTGFNSITTNNGTLRNKGFELEVSADVLTQGDLKWNVGATLYSVRNFVVKLPENDNENNRQGGTQVYNPKTGKVEWVGGYQEGKRVGADEVYAYVQEYVYEDDAAVEEHANRFDANYQSGKEKNRYPGDAAWQDVDKNDTIDYRDRVFLGRTTPDFMGGFTSSLSWKKFNLFVKTDFAKGHLIQSQPLLRGISQVQGAQNSTTLVLDSWTPENRTTDVPRYDFVDPQKNHRRGSSRYWEKGDYLCLREVTLSYDFSPRLFQDYIKGLRLYFTGSNLIYFTDYSGYAPEQGGDDWGRFPVPRVYTLGVNVKF